MEHHTRKQDRHKLVCLEMLNFAKTNTIIARKHQINKFEITSILLKLIINEQ